MKKFSILILLLFQIPTLNSQTYKVPRKHIEIYKSHTSAGFIDNNTKKVYTSNNKKEVVWRNKLGVKTFKTTTIYDRYNNEKEKNIERYSYGILVEKWSFKYGFITISGYKQLVTIVKTIEFNKLGRVINENTVYYDRNKNIIK